MDNKYCYVSVIYDNKISKKSYYYISNLPEIKVNDKVLVNCAGDKVEGTVVNVNYYNKENVPYPVYKTKKILKILNKEENVVMKVDKINKLGKNITLNDNKLDISDNQTYDYKNNIEDEKEEDVDKILKYNNKIIKIALSLITTMVVICIVIFNSNNNNNNNSSATKGLNTNLKNKSNNTDSSTDVSSGYTSNLSKSYSSSSTSISKKDPDTIYGSGYRRTVGVNGTITYYCTKHCTESCKNCKKCLNNQKSFPNSTCTYSYKYSKGTQDKGWTGCPQCGN